jgi:hypothetical protein
MRLDAKIRIQLIQHQQKKYHDKNTRISVPHEIGDKVLYFEAAKDKTHSGKLDQKWKGPYYIHQILLNGSYKIRELDGRVLRTPVNGDLLKIYKDPPF